MASKPAFLDDAVEAHRRRRHNNDTWKAVGTCSNRIDDMGKCHNILSYRSPGGAPSTRQITPLYHNHHWSTRLYSCWTVCFIMMITGYYSLKQLVVYQLLIPSTASVFKSRRIKITLRRWFHSSLSLWFATPTYALFMLPLSDTPSFLFLIY